MEAGGEENELIQNGQITGWACVAGSGEDYGSWETFTSWMQACALELRGDTLTFHAGDAVLPEPPAASGRPLLGAGDTLSLQFRKSARWNGAVLDTDYPRLSCAYAAVERQPEAYTITRQGKRLTLNYHAGIRTMEG